MSEHLVDYSFLEELSGGDPKYKYDVLDIFLNTMKDGLANLTQLVEDMEDFDAIEKQAHALKSSTSIIKVKDMYDHLANIEALGREKGDTGKIRALFDRMMSTYNDALPFIKKEHEKYKPEDV